MKTGNNGPGRTARLAVAAAVVIFAAGAMSCTGWQRAAHDVNVSGEDIVYLRDERTNLCFAVLYLENMIGTKVKHMAITSVPCEALGTVPTR